MKDFFISYNKADKAWAEWISWVLEENGYTVIIQAWDLRPGGNFILDMQRATVEADRMVMVLSDDYLNALYTQPEWAAFFKQDPTGTTRKILPVQVAPCQPQGMLAPLTRVKLIGLDPETARQELLNALKDRLKPDTAPAFPGSPLPQAERITPAQVAFPGTPNNLPRTGTVKFVGREDDLANLHTQLHQSDRVAITALRGMGGIGKTELALQYALHHRDAGTYPGGICWLQAKEQDIGTEIVNFALTHLNLTPPDGLELPQQVAYIWQHWSTPGDVLVVIDDVGDVGSTDEIAAYNAIKPYLPPQESRFRVPLTTRLQLGASIRTVQIDVLSEAASLELLRSLVGTERVDQELDTAKALCDWLGYLPLGLELVGRFLARKTWSLAKMQQQLNEKRLEAKALIHAQPDMTTTHESAAAAFELSWQDLEPEAQALAYRLCLFALAPIPWVIVESLYKSDHQPFTKKLTSYVWQRLRGQKQTNKLDELEDWRDDGLINRSLLNRVGADAVQLHQLIREFFRAKLEQWPDATALKQRYCQSMVRVAQSIPQTPTRDQIVAVTPAIPHMAEAATTWQPWLEDEIVDWPFIGLGRFYQGQGAYGQAEPWWRDCLRVTRDRLGEAHPDVATSLSSLALLYQSQGRYSEAEPLSREALTLRQRLLGDDHPGVATSMNNLGILYGIQGRYGEAEPFLCDALTLRQRILGSDHPDVANSMRSLGRFYEIQGRYGEAEPFLCDALTLSQRILGNDHPDVAESMSKLASLYQSQERYSEAEPLYRDALSLYQRLLGDDHPTVADILNNLAELYRSQGRYSEAEPLYQKSLLVSQRLLGEDHPDVATSMNNLALLYDAQGRYSESEPLYYKALALYQQCLGENHPAVAQSMSNLAGLYYLQGRYSEAEPLCIQALSIAVQRLGEGHPQTQTYWSNFVGLLKAVVAAGQTHLLSNHPTTQALLAQLQP